MPRSKVRGQLDLLQEEAPGEIEVAPRTTRTFLSSHPSNDFAVGFTGTQRGMTVQQALSVKRLLRLFEWTHFHHGDCIGADAEAHEIAIERGLKIVLHPPEIDDKRAWKFSEDTRRPKPYLDRNHDIVDECWYMVAAPGEDVEQLRSGTWATVRYARKLHRSLWLVLPSGEVVGPQP